MGKQISSEILIIIYTLKLTCLVICWTMLACTSAFKLLLDSSELSVPTTCWNLAADPGGWCIICWCAETGTSIWWFCIVCAAWNCAGGEWNDFGPKQTII